MALGTLAGHEDIGDGALGEDLDAGLVIAGVRLVDLLQLDDLLLQRADHFEAGAVADVSEAGVLVSAEVALADLALGGAVEQRAPGLELPDPVGCLLGMELGHPVVIEELAAAHRVAEVHVPAVVRVDVGHRRGDAALGHDGVRLAEERLAHDRDGLARLASLDGCSQPGPARADDDDVEGIPLSVRHGVPDP